MTLSQTRAARLPDGRHCDALGLYLLVRGEKRYWEFRYERAGKDNWMGLGRFADLSLEDARDAARVARNLLREGKDPLAERVAVRAENFKASAGLKLFSEATDSYIAANAAEWGENTKHDIEKRLERYALPTLGKLPVRSIDNAAIIETLTPIWEMKYKTAEDLLRKIAEIVLHAKAKGWASGDIDKALVRKGLPKVKHVTEHRKSLPYEKMFSFMKELSAIETSAARATEFCILTVVRTDEARLVTWDEIDLKNKRWNIPAGRLRKTDRAHSVPLSPRTLDLLKSLPREEGSNYVFIGTKKGKPLSDKALLKTVQSIEDVHTHGFRTTCRGWLEKTFPNVQKIVREMIIAHDERSETEKAYNRTDYFEERVPLMAAWERFCYARPVDATVTPIRRVG
jgi:integrase